MLYFYYDLRTPPGNRLEALRGDYKGYHSIRINAQWRIIFRWQVWWSRFLGQRFWFSSFDSFLLSCSPVHPCWRSVSYCGVPSLIIVAANLGFTQFKEFFSIFWFMQIKFLIFNASKETFDISIVGCTAFSVHRYFDRFQ